MEQTLKLLCRFRDKQVKFRSHPQRATLPPFAINTPSITMSHHVHPDLPTSSEPALSNEALEELDNMLDALRAHSDEIPQWEFCDGFLTALVCTRRTISTAEWLPMLLGDGEPVAIPENQPLPTLAVFDSDAQQARFLELAERRITEIRTQLDTEVNSLQDDAAFQPEVMDTRGAVLLLPEAERAALSQEEIPSFAQVWALGFMFVVENWAQDWAAPRDKQAAQWLDGAMEFIVTLTEDDDASPTLNLYEETGPASTSQERVDAFGEAIWAVYDLRQLWRSLGPLQSTLIKEAQPGRNDPCTCGSDKKFKKCCGA